MVKFGNKEIIPGKTIYYHAARGNGRSNETNEMIARIVFNDKRIKYFKIYKRMALISVIIAFIASINCLICSYTLHRIKNENRVLEEQIRVCYDENNEYVSKD